MLPLTSNSIVRAPPGSTARIYQLALRPDSSVDLIA
jgi:hypothetical protein